MIHKKSDREIRECIEAQKELCKKRGYPHFAPYDGICWICRRNIYQFYSHDWEKCERITGITNEEAATVLVTGCPHCYRTYCD